jgi:hypothetical protein
MQRFTAWAQIQYALLLTVRLLPQGQPCGCGSGCRLQGVYRPARPHHKAQAGPHANYVNKTRRISGRKLARGLGLEFYNCTLQATLIGCLFSLLHCPKSFSCLSGRKPARDRGFYRILKLHTAGYSNWLPILLTTLS